MSFWDENRAGWHTHSGDARSVGDIDFSRIIHSASFRRLQGKTQILNLGESDFYRNRLTHSMEVSQIATGLLSSFEKAYGQDNTDLAESSAIAAALPERSLVQTIAMSHDLGHPPFGHGGEVALNYCMRDHGGFEGNGQTLRLLSKLETFSKDCGANLSRRALLGTLKYPVSYSAAFSPHRRPVLAEGPTVVQLIDRERSTPPKCYLDSEQEVVDWLLQALSDRDKEGFIRTKRKDDASFAKALHKSFDCSIMDIADDIAYGVHDLEDALEMELIGEEDLRSVLPEDVCFAFLEHMRTMKSFKEVNDLYSRFVGALTNRSGERKRFIGLLVGFFIQHCSVEVLEDFSEAQLRYRAKMAPDAAALLDQLKKLVFDAVILSPTVQQLEFKGQQMVVSVFEAYCSEPKAFLPKAVYQSYLDKGRDLRPICDYIASMTDHLLMKSYDRLFSPRMGSVFDRLS